VPSAVTARVVLSFVLGVVMLVLGVFVAFRPLWAHGVPFTGARWLDVAFALVFILRGLMNVSSTRSKMRKRNVP
jgi:uncharacterized membrane protein HdeD (DUF308 family)